MTLAEQFDLIRSGKMYTDLTPSSSQLAKRRFS